MSEIFPEEVPDVDIVWNDETEDWTKQSWDFINDDGSPIDNLDDLSLFTGRDVDSLARDLVRLPFGRSAPPALIEEAMSRGSSDAP